MEARLALELAARGDGVGSRQPQRGLPLCSLLGGERAGRGREEEAFLVLLLPNTEESGGQLRRQPLDLSGSRPYFTGAHVYEARTRTTISGPPHGLLFGRGNELAGCPGDERDGPHGGCGQR
jgi:hypothetical protein